MSNQILRLAVCGSDRTETEVKPGTGDPLHTQELVTVASFRTWRGWREDVARDRYLTAVILALRPRSTEVLFTARREIANNRMSLVNRAEFFNHIVGCIPGAIL